LTQEIILAKNLLVLKKHFNAMPAGRHHDRITLWTLPLVAGVALAITHNSTLTLVTCGGFLFGGLMFGPDLDTHSVQFKRWGWLRWIWIPYRGSIAHRSPLSHAPVTGTVFRLVYLSLWLALMSLVGVTILNQIGQLGWTWADIVGFVRRSLHPYQTHGIALITGIELGACSHYLADGSVTLYRRVQRRGWQALRPPPIRPQRRSTGRKPKKPGLRKPATDRKSKR
jgi:uncharacterized metal-binding protein